MINLDTRITFRTTKRIKRHLKLLSLESEQSVGDYLNTVLKNHIRGKKSKRRPAVVNEH